MILMIDYNIKDNIDNLVNTNNDDDDDNDDKNNTLGWTDGVSSRIPSRSVQRGPRTKPQGHTTKS